MKIILNTHFEIIGGEMIRNLELLVFLCYDSWLGWWNEQLWCFILWKIMDWSWFHGLVEGFDVEKMRNEFYDSKNLVCYVISVFGRYLVRFNILY
jgi:hypothetical protein